MNTIIDKLNECISKNPFFLDENGEVIKEKVKTSAINMDEELMEILLSNEELKECFFCQKKGFLVFDKVKFSWIVSNSNFLPDSFTSYKNKIGLIDSNGDFLKFKDDVTLSFPYKDCILEFDSTEEKVRRDEIFLNETLSKDKIDVLLQPKAFGNFKKHESRINKFFCNDPSCLLIKGNNLLVLNSLTKKYEGQIKLMYWDILYNTDSDNVPYNDSFKHSSWLTMMKNRLEVAQQLLSIDGLIFIQCNDIEMAYLKVLMDEVFRRENYVNTITVKTKIAGVTGSSEGKSLIDATEFILVFAKDKSRIFLKPTTSGTPLLDFIQGYKDEGKSWKYTTVLVEKGEKHLIKEDELNGYKYYGYTNTKTMSIREFAASNSITEDDVYLKYYDRIFRTTNAQSSVRQTVEDETSSLPYEFIGLEYVPIKGKNAGKTIEILYKGTSRAMVTFLSEMIIIDDNQPLYKDRISTIWTDIDYNNLKKEGGVELPYGKKPERLVSRIIELCTDENDIVLDAYLGTGTTGAVAKKMNRRFIGIEQLDDHFKKALVRLQNVIDGDSTGISNDIGWNGGGSFMSCELIDDNNRYLLKIQKATSSEVLVNIFDELLSNPGVLNYNIKLDELKSIRDVDFSGLSLDLQKKILIALLDKNTLYINKSDIDDKEKGVLESDIKFTKSFYGE